MRVAVLGAFPFPYPQGSQIYVTDHARALRREGLEPVLFSYGRGIGALPDDLEVISSPRWISPSVMRSGPSLGKFPGDAALFLTFLAAHRARPFDIALAHNAEAAVIALLARHITGVPVVYIAHTILRFELSSYAGPQWGPRLDRIGRRVDDYLIRSADGVLTLTRDAADLLGVGVRRLACVVPPGLDPEPAPSARRIADVTTRFNLAPGRYSLYAGNLDGYQELHLLVDAARELARKSPDPDPIVIASHDRSRMALDPVPGLRWIEVTNFEEMRALTFGAGELLLTRRRRGGFPIKLLNYMDAARPIVAFEQIAPGLRHRESAWLLDPSAGGRVWAASLDTLRNDANLADALGQGAKRVLYAEHGWKQLAARTRSFLEVLVDAKR